MSHKRIEFHTDWFDLESEEFDDVPHLRGKRMYRLLAPDSVVVCARTPEQKMIMVRQFRHAYGHSTLEFPAGAIDPGESPESAVLREFYEETGYRCGRIEFLCNAQVAADRIRSKIFIFIGYDAIHDSAHVPEDGVEVVLYSDEELNEYLLASASIHAPTLGILYFTQLKKK